MLQWSHRTGLFAGADSTTLSISATALLKLMASILRGKGTEHVSMPNRKHGLGRSGEGG